MSDVTVLELVGVVGSSLAAAAMLIAVLMPGRADRFIALILGSGWLATMLAAAPSSITSRALPVGIAIVFGTLVVIFTSRIAHDPRFHVAVFALIGATLPLRLPVHIGSTDASLLVPLYVLTGVTLAIILASDLGPNLRDRTTLDIGVGVIACLTLMSVSWAYDLDAAMLKAAAFVIPFSILYLSARRVWTARVALAAGLGLITTMSVNAIIALYQHQTQTLWQNTKVEVANEFGSVFRVNALFFDPNILGRYLVASLLALMVWVVFRAPTKRSHLMLVIAASSIQLLALWWTYSQSSLLALSAGLLLIGAWLGRKVLRRITYVVLSIACLAGVAIMIVAPGVVLDDGRRQIASTGVTLASFRPVHGLGLGSFEAGVTDLSEDRGGRPPRLLSSHTTPITFAVEQGVLGIGAWVLLLATASAVAVGTASRAWDAGGSAQAGRHNRLPIRQMGAAWGAATLLALTVHSLFYASFIEDPLVWMSCAALASGARLNPRKSSDVITAELLLTEGSADNSTG